MRFIPLFSICFILISQTPLTGYCQPPDMLRTAEITKISGKTLTLLQSDKRIQEVTCNENMPCVRSEHASLDELNPGDRVRVMGFSEGQSVKVKVIVAEAMIKPMPKHLFSGREDNKVHIGIIARKHPLSLLQDSGETLSLQTSPDTMVIKEYPLDISTVSVGERAQLFPVKLIVLPERDNAVFLPGNGGKKPEGQHLNPPHHVAYKSMPGKPVFAHASHTRSSGTLLPDIMQQPVSPPFIYGAWIGRGLYSNEELDRAFRLVKNLGVRYIKVEFKWGYVEPGNNKWRWKDQAFLDVEHVISLALKYELSVIPYFDLFMPWGKRRHIPADRNQCDGPRSRWGQFLAPAPEEYAEYVFSVIDFLKKAGVDVAFAELDNEVSVMIDKDKSWNCFIDITPRQLKQAENLAYDRVKAKYPEVMISSTTFNLPGILAEAPPEVFEKFTRRLNNFVKAYFQESPKPKFDFLGVHETFHGSGNPFTTLPHQKNHNEYSFSSYHDAYDIWRNILDTNGYRDLPIFVTESQVTHGGLQDVELLQKVIFVRTQAARNKVRGWVLSQLSGSRKFTEKIPGNDESLNVDRKDPPQPDFPAFSVGIADLGESYQLREGYYAFRTMMTILARYPEYKGTVMGQVNSSQPWVEEFSNMKGDRLFAAFIPWNMHRHGPTTRISLNVGAAREVKLTSSKGIQSRRRSDSAGNLSLLITQHPVFIEVAR
ncbi:MAG: hypothetical protein CSA32_03550 [Desulfobulbus propionicus]|nr:MAG: hypothetical protein CSA32_03550 [Desulfobulbus propionicus]